jgi:ribonuclease-3
MMSSLSSSSSSSASSSTSGALKQLQENIGYNFNDIDLLVEAMTQASYVNEHANSRSNERLEHLGDAVLGLVMTEELYAMFVVDTEAELTERRKHLVSESICAAVAERLGLGRHLRLGVGEEKQGGRSHPARLADALEALIGAVHLDCGLDFAHTRAVVLRMYGPILPYVTAVIGPTSGDAKSALQVAVQSVLMQPQVDIEYRIVRSIGPDHAPTHTVEVVILGKVQGRGTGAKKKAAEQQAAQSVLNRWESVRRELEKIGSKL